jgi:hypothetical protein
MSCSILLILPAPCETPDTAVSSKPRTHAIDSELESEYDDAIFGDGDTDVESSVAAARLVPSPILDEAINGQWFFPIRQTLNLSLRLFPSTATIHYSLSIRRFMLRFMRF